MSQDAKATFSRTVPVRLVCRRCHARYEYDRVLSDSRKVRPGEEAAAVAAAEVELDRQQAGSDLSIVRCPQCGKFAPGALVNRLINVGICLGSAAVCGAAAVGLIVLAGMTGQLFWFFALAAGLGCAVFLLLGVFSLLSPTTHRTRLVLG